MSVLSPCASYACSGLLSTMRTQAKQNLYRDKLTELYEQAMSLKHNNAPKAIALFSDCGGLSLGFAAEGFKLLGHVEIEDSANKIYGDNFPDSVLLGQDICTISDEEMHKWIVECGDIDILIGGPPCQGFSLAGKRNPEDARNNFINIMCIWFRFYNRKSL